MSFCGKLKNGSPKDKSLTSVNVIFKKDHCMCDYSESCHEKIILGYLCRPSIQQQMSFPEEEVDLRLREDSTGKRRW